MTTTVPRSEIQTLDPGALVSLYELDASAIGGIITRWCPFVNRLGVPVVWQGNTYNPFPLDSVGFEKVADGALPRPHLKLANLDGTIGTMCRTYQDLVGATVTRLQTMEKFLDAVNFPDYATLGSAANPTAGPYAYPPEMWIIEQKVNETKDIIEFELVAACDATGLRLPARKMQANTCGWTKVSDPNAGNCPYVATCAKTLGACKANFGTTVDLPFGGFPGLMMVRQ